MTTDRFEDLDLREEPAGTDRSRGEPALTYAGCTQYTFGCTTLNAPLTGGCCE
jgi:hypothetical protein